MTRARILLCSHYFSSHKGGVEIVVEHLFQQFTAAGHEVTWVATDSTPPPPAINRSSAVPVRAFHFVENKIGIPFPIPTIAALRKIEKEVERADIVILHDCLYLSNITAFRAARRRGLPIIVVQHIGHVPYRNIALNLLMKMANAFITKPMLGQASQAVFISAITRQFFSEVQFQRPPATLFNGVDTGLYRPLLASERKAELRERYQLQKEGVVILFVGRFVEKKGLAILELMVRSKSSYTWAFAGWGPLDPRTWNAPNVKVFTGLQGESMAALYRACDLLVLPSVGEGFPLVVQEALASGLPVVCGAETTSADPDLASFITGVSIDAGDPEQTAREFERAIDNVLVSESGTVHVTQRREFVMRRYSWEHTARRYLDLASLLVGEGSTQGTSGVPGSNERS